jgi:hypothetical protein
VSDEQAEPQSWWKQRYHCGPLKAFVLTALLGAVTGAVVAMLVDIRDVQIMVTMAAFFAAIGGMVGSTFALHANYLVWSERCQIFTGFMILVSIAVGLHFGVWQAVANRGLLLLLVYFGTLSGLIHFTVCGMCGVLLGLVNLRKPSTDR